MYRSLFARDVFAELDRLQREVSTLFDYSPSIRGVGRGPENGHKHHEQQEVPAYEPRDGQVL